MHYEEKMIDGLMHYRTTPDGEFVAYTLEQISYRHKRLQEQAKAERERAYLDGKQYEKCRIAELLGLGTLNGQVV